jgi:CelD/BcsL family acetyltransferase involved in cellulose biosynthesis
MTNGLTGRYHIERIDGEAGMAALRDGWAALHAETPDAPIFLTWEWVDAWQRNREAGWELWVLAACDETGRLAGVAPWTRMRHHYGPLTLDRLAFVGDHRSYRIHLDVLARPDEKNAVFAAMLDYLASQPRAWDVLDLEALAAGSAVQETLALAGRGGRRYHQVETLPCPYTRLPDSWETYEREQLSAEHRKWIKNRRNRLEKDFPGQVVFERVTDAASLPAAMDDLAALHQKRWHGKGQGSSFDHESFRGFQRDVAALALAHDWLRLYFLRVNGHAIAVEYFFLHGGVLFDYAKAFDPDWSRYSPGQLLMAHVVQDAIGEGVRELDLGRGSFDYKFRWTDQERVDSHVVLSASPTGHLWAYGGAAIRRAKDLAREKLPESVRARVNRMVG